MCHCSYISVNRPSTERKSAPILLGGGLKVEIQNDVNEN